MRVISGKAKSMPLKAPKGQNTRPTTDRIKETLFNMLNFYVEGSVFVDCFSGSGAIGIEALSRGAKKAYFIEKGAEALSCIKENLKFTKLQDSAIVLSTDVCAALYSISEKKVDIVFMDPPYEEGLEKKALEVLKTASYIDEDSLIVVEADINTNFDYLEEFGFEIFKEKKYKTNKHLFIKKQTTMEE